MSVINLTSSPTSVPLLTGQQLMIVENLGISPVYYRSVANVTPQSFDGEIAGGQSTQFYAGPVWFAASVSAQIGVTYVSLPAPGVPLGLNVISPATYGAVGDGITDDSTAIQAAINAIPAAGGHVLLDNVTYFCNGATQISLKGGQRIVGRGWGSILKGGAGIGAGNAIIRMDRGGIIDLDGADVGWGVENLCVDGGGVGNGTWGIYDGNYSSGSHYFSRDTWISRCLIQNCHVGIRHVQTQGTSVVDTLIQLCNYGTYASDNAQLCDYQHVEYRDSHIIATLLESSGNIINPPSGPASDQPYGFLFTRCQWESNESKDVVLDGSSFNSFVGCKWEQSAGDFLTQQQVNGAFTPTNNTLVNPIMNGTPATSRAYTVAALPQTTLSGGQTFPQATTTVVSTAGFPTSGNLVITGVTGLVAYTNIAGNTFTGCTGGTGSPTNGATVWQPSYQVKVTAGNRMTILGGNFNVNATQGINFFSGSSNNVAINTALNSTVTDPGNTLSQLWGTGGGMTLSMPSNSNVITVNAPSGGNADIGWFSWGGGRGRIGFNNGVMQLDDAGSGHALMFRTNNLDRLKLRETASGGTALFTTGIQYNRTTVADIAYTALTTDYIIAYTSISAARVVTLPTASATNKGLFYTIKDESGSATGVITITATPASGTIDGAASKVVVNSAFGSGRVYSNGANWFTI